MPTPSVELFPLTTLYPGSDEPPASAIVWHPNDERYYHTGCDRGVLYTEEGAVAWDGITGVSESGAGGTSVMYRDGVIYYAEVEPGDFEGTVSAFFWPDEFSKALGIPEIAPGLYADNQRPRKFAFTYRSLIGSGNTGDMFGYQIHLVYNAFASIGSRSRKTMTKDPELLEFSFDLTAIPVRLRGFRPTAHFIIDTRGMTAETLAVLEAILYGSSGAAARMPTPLELYDLLNFGSSITYVDHGDGTWSASGSSQNIIDNGDGTWQIFGTDGVDNGDGTYELTDTP